jgi:Lrp/AsnC family leucine-responsive transcriptional regulator
MSLSSEKLSFEQSLDTIDREILALLKSNAKMGNKEIAARIGLSVTPTFERIKRLERQGVILGYEAVLNKKAIGKGLKVLCQVSLKAHNLDLLLGFEDEIVHLDEVSACYHIAGDYDYLLSIEVRDMDEYQKFLKEKLASIANIANVQSSFVMSTLK